MKRRRYSIDPLSYHIVVIFLLLTAALAEAEITPKPYEIAQEVTQHVFRIVASQCSNGVNRILTGFFLQGVGIVTAAHGVIGCKLITATPASGTLPESIAAAVTQIALDRDLAALKWVDAQPPTPQGLSQYNSASKPDLGFNVCGHAS